MSKKFDELFRQIVTILRRDHAGATLLADSFDPRYYNQAIGQAWHDNKLNELLFLRYVSQMLACTGDRHLRLALTPSEHYQPWTPGFFTRRFADSLYVTAVAGDDRFQVGERITAINGASPAVHRANIQKNFFYGDTPEREDWNGLLKMADHVDVVTGTGALQRRTLAHAVPDKGLPAPRWSLLDEDVFYLAPGSGEGLEDVPFPTHSKAWIVDMRFSQGGTEEDFWPLLPYVCPQDTPLSALIDTDLVVNYTRLNCVLKAAGLEGIPGSQDYIQELVQKADTGLVAESEPEDNVIVPGKAAPVVVVLTDTWCRDGGESFVQAARRAGAVLLGRPTLGTLDFCGDVHYALDERFTLTWPTAMTAQAHAGKGILGQGIAPDIYVPWTPEECQRDVLCQRAMEYIKGM
jgi:hypothetical protein